MKPNRDNRGFSLTELLLAMALGTLLISGTLQVYAGVSRSYRSVQELLELEDRAAFALRALASDVRLAGYTRWIDGDPPSLPAGARCSGTDVSGWAAQFATAIEAGTDGSGLPCPARGDVIVGSDMLTIRHLDPNAGDPASGASPWQAHSWYVDSQSSERDAAGRSLPALRRQTLMPDGTVQNQEIMPGVENLQLQLGIDSNADNLIDQFVTASAASSGEIRAVRLQITVRSIDGERRVSVQRLIAIPNALFG